MQACVDEIIGGSQMILAVTSIDKREILKMGIIVKCEIVEDYDSEEFHDFNGCGLHVSADDVGTFFITKVIVFEVTASIGISQSRQGCKILLAVLSSVRTDIKSAADVGRFSITEKTKTVSCCFNMIDLRGQLHGQVLVGRTILPFEKSV